jgi:hypothetical protein
MAKSKNSKFISKMEVAASQLAQMSIESDGTSVLFISTETVDEQIEYVTQVQGSTQGIIAGLIGFATDKETAPIFNEVLKTLKIKKSNGKK